MSDRRISSTDSGSGSDRSGNFVARLKPRRNFRNWNPELNWSPRFSGHRWFRGIRISGDADINLNLDNQVVDRNLRLTPMQLEFHSGDSVEFQLFKQTENLDEDFEISDGVILPLGSS